MEFQDLLLTAGRGILVYFFMLVVIRLLGKRSVGAFSAFDLLVALMLGEVVDEIIYGDVSLVQGFTAVGVVALCHYATGWMGYKNRTLDQLVQGKPAVLVRHGEMQRDAMRQERMSEEDILIQLRLQGIQDIREVMLAILEPSGSVSVFREEWAETVRKCDLPGPEQEQMRQATQAREEPPPDLNTLSKQALGQEAA
jgi:uncharacterized membrane protein YcaP (DUF421 family)